MTIAPISALNLTGIDAIKGINDPQTPTTSTTGSVTQTFEKVLDSLNQSQSQADTLTQQLASGGNVDLSQLMLGIQENDVNYRVALSIRDYLVDAYRQVMQTNV